MLRSRLLLVSALILLGWAAGQIACAQSPTPYGQMPREVLQVLATLREELDSKEPRVRARAARGLARVHDDAVPLIPRLIELLADDSPSGQSSNGMPRVIELLPDQTPTWQSSDGMRMDTVGDFAAQALAAIGEPAVGPLGGILKTGTPSARCRAATVLGESDDPRRIDFLLPAARDDDPSVRWTAVAALAPVREKRVMEAFIAATKDPEEDVNVTAIWALKAWDDPLAADAIIAALDDPSAQVKIEAAHALGEMKSPRAVEALIAALQDGYAPVRAAAACALEQIGDRRAVEPLIALLKHGDGQTRSGAAEALGVLGDRQAVEPLIAALERGQVQGSAAGALAALGDPRAVDPLVAALGKNNAAPVVRAILVFAKTDPRLLDVLVRALRHQDTEVRQEAARALGDLQDKRAVQPLIAALADPDASVGYIAIRALANIGDPKAVPALAAAEEKSPSYRSSDFSQAMRGLGLRKWRWRDDDDFQSTEGVFLGSRDGMVEILRKDGSSVTVAVDHLDDAGREEVLKRLGQPIPWRIAAMEREKVRKRKEEETLKRLADLEESIKAHPESASAEMFLELGSLRLERDSVEKAIDAFNRAIALCPGCVKAYIRRGDMRLLIDEDYEAARTDYRKALELDPNDSEAHHQLVRAYIHEGFQEICWGDSLGDQDKAIVAFNEAIRLEPTLAEVYKDRASAWANKGEFDKAIADLEQALRLCPDDPEQLAGIYNDRAVVWLGKRECAKALADLDKAIRFDPAGYRLRHDLAAVHSAMGDLDAAIADWTEIVRAFLWSPDAYLSRATLRMKKGDYTNALADINRAIHLVDEPSAGLNARAWLLATCPDPAVRDGRKAVEDATRACEAKRWTQWNYLDTLAAAYAETGDFDSAVKWQQEAIALAEKTSAAAAKEQKPALAARLEVYRAGKPFRESPAAPGPQRPE